MIGIFFGLWYGQGVKLFSVFARPARLFAENFIDTALTSSQPRANQAIDKPNLPCYNSADFGLEMARTIWNLLKKGYKSLAGFIPGIRKRMGTI
jgi:hypothetical protein